MLAFGVGFQAVGLAALARNQGVNLVVAAAGGTQLLGFWSLANRLMQVPFWLFMALWRVSYPTMARLRALGEDTRRTVERLARVTALASGATLAPLAASAHYLIPAMFGARWTTAADPLPWASAGLVVAGPISVAAAGYLYSERDVRTPLYATITNGAVWVGTHRGAARADGGRGRRSRLDGGVVDRGGDLRPRAAATGAMWRSSGSWRYRSAWRSCPPSPPTRCGRRSRAGSHAAS